MGANNFEELKDHIGHEVEVVGYRKNGDYKNPVINAAVECLDCNEVLMDFDNPDNKSEEPFNMTEYVVAEIFENAVVPEVEEGSIKNEDDLNEFLNEMTTRTVTNSNDIRIVNENEFFSFSGTDLGEEVIGMFLAYELIYDMAVEIVTEKVKLRIVEEDILDFKIKLQ